MAVERDKNHPNITIIHTAQGDVYFDFGSKGKQINVNIPGVPTLEAFDEPGRKEIEALMEKTFNPGAESTHKLMDLQAKFNETIIATQNGKPLEIGTSANLTSFETGGGGLTRKVDAKGEPVQDVALGINVAEVIKTSYRDNMRKDHKMKPEDILRHELFHYVDKASDPGLITPDKDSPLNNPMFKERRAVWFVNQFQLAEDPPRTQRISYNILDPDLDTGIAGADWKVTGKNMPGVEKGYPEPSPSNHREYPWSKHAAQQSQGSPESLGLPESALNDLKSISAMINQGTHFTEEQKLKLNVILAETINDNTQVKTSEMNL